MTWPDLHRLLKLIPACCMVCNRPTTRNSNLCAVCELQLPWIKHHCHGCGLEFNAAELPANRCGKCLENTSPLDACHSLFRYSVPLNKLIPAFKFQARFDIGLGFSVLLAAAMNQHYRAFVEPELLLPVPMHYRRHLQRGFNQSWELVREVSRITGIPCSNNLVKKCRHTTAQADLGSARERARNLTGAFSMTSDYDLSNVNRVTIIDDVITTMSTISVLADLLKCRGIQRVEAWSVARAGSLNQSIP